MHHSSKWKLKFNIKFKSWISKYEKMAFNITEMSIKLNWNSQETKKIYLILESNVLFYNFLFVLNTINHFLYIYYNIVVCYICIQLNS